MKDVYIDWKELRFGVEIEFVEGDPEAVELLPGWIMALDERQTDDTGEQSGSELKPPPIKWEDREQIREMLTRVHATGAKANWNCGLHVHVGLEPWGDEGIPRFIEGALLYQETLRDLLQTSEDRLVFCPPVTPEIYERYMAAPGETSLLNKGRPQSHRCGINLAAWFDIGTVEFRYANGSLDYNEITAVIELYLRFTAAIGAGCKLPCDPHVMALELGAPLSGYPAPLAAPRWHRERVWLENLLIPELAPLAACLVPDGEIHHITPEAEGFAVAVENTEGKLRHYLLRSSAASWEVIGQLHNRPEH